MHKKNKNKYCHFCVNNLDYIDYKDWQQIKRFTSSYGKIVPKRKSGACSKHQRGIAQAIKRARFMAFLPYLVK